jgi:hypothetical protein
MNENGCLLGEVIVFLKKLIYFLSRLHNNFMPQLEWLAWPKLRLWVKKALRFLCIFFPQFLFFLLNLTFQYCIDDISIFIFFYYIIKYI